MLLDWDFQEIKVGIRVAYLCPHTNCLKKGTVTSIKDSTVEIDSKIIVVAQVPHLAQEGWSMYPSGKILVLD